MARHQPQRVPAQVPVRHPPLCHPCNPLVCRHPLLCAQLERVAQERVPVRVRVVPVPARVAQVAHWYCMHM